jgi:hypothetical protein
MGVFFLFLLATSCGCLFTLFWIPEEDLGRGYFQMHALIVLALLGLALVVALFHPLAPFGDANAGGWLALAVSFVAGFFYHGAVWRERWRFCRWPLALSLAGAGAALLIGGHELAGVASPLPHRDGLLVASLLTSSLLLGWSLVTMLLGHWYLVAPRLTFRHLVTFCWMLLAAVIVRGVALAATVGAADRVDELTEPHPLRVLSGFDGQGMFFWFRVLWGLLVPLLLAVMALHCARQRSNQSATGILYVVVVGTFIGEITAYYLTLTTGIPA